VKNYRFKIILLFGLLMAGVAASWFYFSEPAVDGKPLGDWLREGREEWVSDSQSHKAHVESDADRAVRKIGTRAIPTLLAKLRAKDLAWWDAAAEWVDDNLDVSLPTRPHEAENERFDAMYGFRVLGTQAVVAIPELTRMLYQTNFSYQAGQALGHIGRDATPVIRAALTGGNSRVQFGALSSTYWSRDIGSNVLPEMKALLKSQDERTAALAVLRLRGFLSVQEYMDLVTQVPGTNHFRIQRLALNHMILAKTNLAEAVPGVVRAQKKTTASAPITDRAHRMMMILKRRFFPGIQFPPAPAGFRLPAPLGLRGGGFVSIPCA
jgi:hypothetical protein